MAAITPAMMTALKMTLENRFLPIIPSLLGSQNASLKKDKQISRAFNAFVVQKMFDLPAAEAAVTIVDDFGDNGIDAIYYHEPNTTLYLVQSKLKANAQFLQPEAESFTRGVRLLVEQDLVSFNQFVKDKAAYIENALDLCSNIKLVVAYAGSGITQTAMNALNQLVQDANLDEERLDHEIEYIGADIIEGYLREEEMVRVVNARLCLKNSNSNTIPRKSVFGLVKVDDLINLHLEYDKALYQKNIRYFIGTGRRGVNSAIKNTLEHSPGDFFHLNNGVTVVCESIEAKRSRGGYKNYNVRGLSVVNGAQTISSAAQFKTANPSCDTSSAMVLLTIIQASSRGGFHKKVTKARNLQNPVSLGDFVALDDNQERLRQEMALHGYVYRYRPEAAAIVVEQTIEIDELSKALACFAVDVRYPSRLKSEPGVFVDPGSEEYKAIFVDGLSPFTAINAVIVFRVIRDVVKAADLSSPSPERLIYRHGLYVIASILMKRLNAKIYSDSILDLDEVKREVSAPLDELRQQCFSQYQISLAGNAPHAAFKRISDTSRLIKSVMIVNQNLAEDVAVQRLRSVVNRDDPYNQRLVGYLVDKGVQI